METALIRRAVFHYPGNWAKFATEKWQEFAFVRMANKGFGNTVNSSIESEGMPCSIIRWKYAE